MIRVVQWRAGGTASGQSAPFDGHKRIGALDWCGVKRLLLEAACYNLAKRSRGNGRETCATR